MPDPNTEPARELARAREHLRLAAQFLPASVDVSATSYHMQKVREYLDALAARGETP